MEHAGSRKGFTLLEILIVVAVVGILSALATLAVRKAVTSSRTKTAEVELQMIATAVMQLAWDSGTWPNKAVRTSPGSREIWNIKWDSVGLMGTDSSYDEWKGPYYDGPTVDPWGNNYFFDPDFRVDGVMRIVVGSFGPNGVGRNWYDEDDIYVLLDE